MRFAIRAKSIRTLHGEGAAMGLAALNAPLAAMADGVVLVNGETIEAVEPHAAFQKRQDASSIPLADLGNVTLAPGRINSHCHLELSHIAGQSMRGKGFVPWLRSIVALVAQSPAPEELRRALDVAVGQLTASYTAHVGDISSRAPVAVAEALARSGIAIEDVFKSGRSFFAGPTYSRSSLENLPRPTVSATHFLEVLGFMEPTQSGQIAPGLAAGGYCPSVAHTLPQAQHTHCAISGHALYSTSPQALQAGAAT